MNEKMNNGKCRLHISHVWVDLDGVIPYVIDDVFGINYDYNFGCNYDSERELELYNFVKDCNEEMELVYTDFSPNERMRELISEKKIRTLIFDHHEGVFDELKTWANDKDYVMLELDVERSGTKIYYDWLLGGNKENKVLTEIVNLTDTYDLFRKERPLWGTATKLNRLMYYMMDYNMRTSTEVIEKYSPFIASLSWKCTHMNTFKFSDFEMKKIEKSIKSEQEMFRDIDNGKIKMVTRQDEKGDYFLVLKVDKKVSAVTDYLLNKYKKVKYVLVVNDFDKDEMKISARCRDDFSVLNLENICGHEGAGGYNGVTNQICESLLNGELYSLKRLD